MIVKIYRKAVRSMDVAVDNCRIIKKLWFVSVLFKCEMCGYLYPENIIHTPLLSPNAVKQLSFRCMGCGEMRELSIRGGGTN